MSQPPVGIIGPRKATKAQLQTAQDLGRALAEAGYVVLTGGKEGVMEAACKGVKMGGGLSIGLLPDDNWEAANPFVDIPIATGIGPARNTIIANASKCLVVIGGGYGTLSEIAFALQFDRPVFGLDGSPELDGMEMCKDVAEVLDRVTKVMGGV